MRLPAPILCVLAGLSLAACERHPVQWTQELGRFDKARASIGSPFWMAYDSASGPTFGTLLLPVLPDSASACPGSLTAADSRTGESVAAWFVARPDGSVQLMVARSSNFGASLSRAVIADARDRGRRGCDRPPPAIALDTVSDFVHVAYFLEPPEGAGVWLVHSMEHGAMWHSPVPIAFGADAAGVDVAADHDTVVVAYESPNAHEGWIGLALSSSDGHLIDWRVPEVSGRSVPVNTPHIARSHRTIVVAWVTQRGSLATFRTGVLQ